jgi:hypothetical protein
MSDKDDKKPGVPIEVSDFTLELSVDPLPTIDMAKLVQDLTTITTIGIGSPPDNFNCRCNSNVSSALAERHWFQSRFMPLHESGDYPTSLIKDFVIDKPFDPVRYSKSVSEAQVEFDKIFSMNDLTK